MTPFDSKSRERSRRRNRPVARRLGRYPKLARTLVLLHAGVTLGLVPSFVLCVEENGRAALEIADSKGHCANEYSRKHGDRLSPASVHEGGHGCVDLAIAGTPLGELRRDAAPAAVVSRTVAHALLDPTPRHASFEGPLVPRSTSPPRSVVLQI